MKLIQILKLLNLNLVIESPITEYTNIFSQGLINNCSGEVFITDSVMKTNHWTNKFKDLNREKNNRKF